MLSYSPARVERVYDDIEASIKKRTILVDFQMNKLSLVISRVTALMGMLVRILSLLLEFLVLRRLMEKVLFIALAVMMYMSVLSYWLCLTRISNTGFSIKVSLKTIS